MPPGGLICRWPDDRYDQDRRLQDYRDSPRSAFARANKVNRITMDSPNARFGIMASGKSYEASARRCAQLGITRRSRRKSVCGLQDRHAVAAGAARRARICVGLEETLHHRRAPRDRRKSVKQELSTGATACAARIVGKMDDHDKRFLPFARNSASLRSRARSTERLLRLNLNPEIAAMLRAKADWLTAGSQARCRRWRRSRARRISARAVRITPRPGARAVERLPASAALHGVVDGRKPKTFTHMGGEGVPWSVSRRSRREARVPNLGDGTYFHSGSLAIRQAVGPPRQHHL